MNDSHGLAALSHAVTTAYPSVTLELHVDPVGDLVLDKIVVPADQRGGGFGSAVMEVVIAHADAIDIRMALTPSDDFGGTVSRLRVFYKRFGFVDNSGRGRDFSTRQAMSREPTGR